MLNIWLLFDYSSTDSWQYLAAQNCLKCEQWGQQATDLLEKKGVFFVQTIFSKNDTKDRFITYYWKKFTLKDEHDGDNNHLSDFSNWLQLLLFIYLTYTNFVRCLFCLFNVSRPCLFFFMCNFGYLKIKDWFSVYSNKYKVCENIFQMKNGD